MLQLSPHSVASSVAAPLEGDGAGVRGGGLRGALWDKFHCYYSMKYWRNWWHKYHSKVQHFLCRELWIQLFIPWVWTTATRYSQAGNQRKCTEPTHPTLGIVILVHCHLVTSWLWSRLLYDQGGGWICLQVHLSTLHREQEATTTSEHLVHGRSQQMVEPKLHLDSWWGRFSIFILRYGSYYGTRCLELFILQYGKLCH